MIHSLLITIAKKILYSASRQTTMKTLFTGYRTFTKYRNPFPSFSIKSGNTSIKNGFEQQSCRSLS